MTDNTSLAALKPCPWCGGNACIEPKNWAGRDFIGVFCEECLVFQDSRSGTNADAIAAWNTRAADQRCAELEAENARLREALKTERDYIADAASGALTYEGSGDGFKAMAAEDLACVDALIAETSAALENRDD